MSRGVFAQCNNTVSTPCPFGHLSLISSSNTRLVHTIGKSSFLTFFCCCLFNNILFCFTAAIAMTPCEQLCRKAIREVRSTLIMYWRQSSNGAVEKYSVTINSPAFRFLLKRKYKSIGIKIHLKYQNEKYSLCRMSHFRILYITGI